MAFHNSAACRRACLFFIALFFCMFNAVGQSSWNSNSFKLTRDNTPLADMTGATTGSTSAPIPFDNFQFRYGTNSYSSFYISVYGFIKLGGPIISDNPEADSSVIVALYNGGTPWNVSYKSAGTAPNRKMIIQYSGVMQPTGEPTKYQIWLSERTGKIELVYEKLKGYYGYPTVAQYRIFCNTMINNVLNKASIKVNANNAQPVMNYGSVIRSFDSIYANTRYTLQPDTIKPATPSQLAFSSVQSGCLTVDITENSDNESVLVLQRATGSSSYAPETSIYVSNPAGSVVHHYAQTLLQPSKIYNYRVFVSNGFINSDTLYNTVQSLPPQISGIKRIPGDYPSVTALLADAACKHMGPNLVIELQASYSFAAETLPIQFSKKLQHELIQSIVIRPAANAVINWDGSSPGALFYVDSVKHVWIDGSTGGTGNNQSFTIFQQNTQKPAIQYSNHADSGGIMNCKIFKKNASNAANPVVLIVPLNPSANQFYPTVNDFSFVNNFVSTDATSMGFLLNIRAEDANSCRNFTITGNQFSRFNQAAVYFENGGENARISGNTFFQPEVVSPYAALPSPYAAAIKLINNGSLKVQDNNFGGSTPVWGQGSYQVNLSPGIASFNFIHYENSSLEKTALISGNQFANIRSLNSGIGMIFAEGGNVTVDQNKIGSTDSLQSLKFSASFALMNFGNGKKTISNNSISGITGDYQSGSIGFNSYFVSTNSEDTVRIYNNDFGGSNNPLTNTVNGKFSIISAVTQGICMDIRKNNIRGFSSLKQDAVGIDFVHGITSDQSNVFIDSNQIHHIKAARSVAGIDALVHSIGKNRIANNEISALYSDGSVSNPGGCYMQGINFMVYSNTFSNPTGMLPYNGDLDVWGNKIHSIVPIRTNPATVFNVTGIAASGAHSAIWNNDIRLGLNTLGATIDSVSTGVTGIYAGGRTAAVEHNSIYIGGRGTVGSAIQNLNSENPASQKTMFILNNILKTDRDKTGNSVSYKDFISMTGYTVVGAKNLWHSAAIPNVAGLLQQYKQSCNCDSTSFEGDPVFIDALGDSIHYSLHLGAGSNADTKGTPSLTAIASDRDGTNRNAYSPVDIGCYAATPCGSGSFPAISITAPAGDSVGICSGNPFTITTAVSGGTFQELQWQRNFTDSIGATNAAITVSRTGAYRLVGKTACGQVASRIIYVVSATSLVPAITIATASSTVCAGATVQFTATATNGGATPAYQWKRNSNNVGTNAAVFSANNLQQGDVITCVLTSSLSCATPATATSNSITMNITQGIFAFAGNDTSICTGTSAQLQATGGTSYIWSPATGLSNPNIANPVATPASTTEYTVTVGNGSGCSATDKVIVTVTNNAVVQVTITINSNNLCAGQTASFTATVQNGGPAPVYQWQVNGANAGTNAPAFSSNTLHHGDLVKCLVTGSSPCGAPGTVSSNGINVSINTLAVPVLEISGHTLTVSNPQAGAVYEWQAFDGLQWAAITGATGTMYDAPQPGEYRVKATLGQCTAYSASLHSIQRNPANNYFGIYVYPNPATSVLRLDEIKLSQHWEYIDLFDMHGRRAIPTVDIRGRTSVSIPVEHLAGGVYILRLTNFEQRHISFKISKQ